MRKTILSALAIGMLSSAAYAADLELVAGRTYQNSSYFEQPYTLKNHTKHLIKYVRVECGMFNNDELIESTRMAFENVPPQGELYGFVNSLQIPITDVKCRITDAE